MGLLHICLFCDLERLLYYRDLKLACKDKPQKEHEGAALRQYFYIEEVMGNVLPHQTSGSISNAQPKFDLYSLTLLVDYHFDGD
jgi:hypothetical protein